MDDFKVLEFESSCANTLVIKQARPPPEQLDCRAGSASMLAASAISATVADQKLKELIELIGQKSLFWLEKCRHHIYIEKILRVQPNVKKLYLLLRAADTKSALNRFNNEVISKDLFGVLKEKRGANLSAFILEKVTIVPGDITCDNLRIDDLKLSLEISTEIDVVINLAATTNFDERNIDSFVLGYGKGKMKCFPGDPQSIVDLIPADMVVNAMIAAMVAHADQPGTHIIYHVGSSMANPVSYNSLQDYGLRYFTKNPWSGKDGKPVIVVKGKQLSSVAMFQRYMDIHYLIPLKVNHIGQPLLQHGYINASSCSLTIMLVKNGVLEMSFQISSKAKESKNDISSLVGMNSILDSKNKEEALVGETFVWLILLAGTRAWSVHVSPPMETIPQDWELDKAVCLPGRSPQWLPKS
ncbi:Fatty acyl-CoA reductase [Forsythia ovata]|uniref:Fatty acyl-CoA reductase n=1 Tax=Forsythia ovata TaxID=205694 RepID=A0ABD1X601_9LAMI